MNAFTTQSALRGALKLTAFEHAWAFYRNDLTPDRIEREYAATFHLACRLRRAEEAQAAHRGLLADRCIACPAPSRQPCKAARCRVKTFIEQCCK